VGEEEVGKKKGEKRKETQQGKRKCTG